MQTSMVPWPLLVKVTSVTFESMVTVALLPSGSGVVFPPWVTVMPVTEMPACGVSLTVT